MPHLKIEYTANLDAHADIGELCKTLSHTLVTLKDAAGSLVFPLYGTRVLAYPAAQYAVADASRDGLSSISICASRRAAVRSWCR